MSEFAGFVEAGNHIVLPVMTSATYRAVEAPDAAPSFDVYSVTSSGMTSVLASQTADAVSGVTGLYSCDIDTGVAGLDASAGETYCAIIEYDISSTTYTVHYTFQVV